VGARKPIHISHPQRYPKTSSEAASSSHEGDIDLLEPVPKALREAVKFRQARYKLGAGDQAGAGTRVRRPHKCRMGVADKLSIFGNR
jgi:hypothetical protein